MKMIEGMVVGQVLKTIIWIHSEAIERKTLLELHLCNHLTGVCFAFLVRQKYFWNDSGMSDISNKRSVLRILKGIKFCCLSILLMRFFSWSVSSICFLKYICQSGWNFVSYFRKIQLFLLRSKNEKFYVPTWWIIIFL